MNNRVKKYLRRLRNAAITVGLFAIGLLIYRLYLQSFTSFDFSHLTPSRSAYETSEFSPIEGSSVPNMVRVAENEILALYINEQTTAIAVYDKRNSHVWHSSPPGMNQDPIANPFERNIMSSLIGLRYFNALNREIPQWSYNDSVAFGQTEIFGIPNGVSIKYTMGNTDLGINALPRHIEVTRFQERVLAQVEDNEDIRFLNRNWLEFDIKPGFVQMLEGARTGVNAKRMLDIFERIGYTADELEFDNEAAGYESDISFDIITMYIEITLEGDSLVFNVPLDRVVLASEEHSISRIDIMRYFGAGGAEDEGFMFVPGGSGALIEFNNGKHMEEQYAGNVYGLDFLMHMIHPQMVQPVRLPVLGINKGSAALVAHIENGAALATVNADVAGRLSSFNYTYFSFSIRNFQDLNLGLTGINPSALTSMTAVQSHGYEGDITVRYHFIAGDEISIGDMAAVYQRFLVNTGALTPLTGVSDRTFYLDIIGAADVRRHILGTPYSTLELMTTFEEMEGILDILNHGGVENIQLILHGWFNRGLNHDVAKNIRRVRGLGSLQAMQNLDKRLNASGGGLNPAINFKTTSYHSRNINHNFEATRDIAGMAGIMSGIARDALSSFFSLHNNDWFYLVNPAALPAHINSFAEAYKNLNISGVALTDLGSLVNENMYRRNPVDREHSRLISAEQLGKLNYDFNNMVVFGGNDFSLRYASHLVDIPTGTDRFYIIDSEVPFYQMVMFGFIEFAGVPVNLQRAQDPHRDLLTSIATGASPRFTMTGRLTRLFRFTPHERLYSTFYRNWVETAIEHYRVFNEVYRNLFSERIVNFTVIHDDGGTFGTASTVTVTEFSNGTRIYVNNTRQPFIFGDLYIEPLWFKVV